MAPNSSGNKKRLIRTSEDLYQMLMQHKRLLEEIHGQHHKSFSIDEALKNLLYMNANNREYLEELKKQAEKMAKDIEKEKRRQDKE